MSKENLNSNPPSIWDKCEVLCAVALCRFICLILWIYCVSYATLTLYWASEDHRLRNRYLGIFTPNPIWPINLIVTKQRDSQDEEWNGFINVLTSRLIWWFFIYIVLSHLLAKFSIQVRMGMSMVVSGGFCISFMGWKSLVFLLQQPLMYCILMNQFRSKVVIWTVTIIGLWLTNFDWILEFYVPAYKHNRLTLERHWFEIISAWNFARCLSFSFDNWDQPKISLTKCLQYCFYFPTLVSGPIVLYSLFDRDILKKQGANRSLKQLFKKLFYIVFIIYLCEGILRILHFQRLAMDYKTLMKLDLWVLGGILFWSGQFFMLKYTVMYGISTYIAEYEGLQMPPLPKCPSHIHRYSVIWKDFDRGLYDFLLKYTYIPIIRSLEAFPKTRILHPESNKLIASLLTFLYVYIWHGINPTVKIWSIFNFIGITIERFGSYLKKKIDLRMEVHPIVWDFVVEPIVTVPLAIISILNSSVFLCSIKTASIIGQRFWESWQDNYIIPIVFCLTHVAVTVRTLRTFISKVITFKKE